MFSAVRAYLDRKFGRCVLERRKKKSLVIVERRQRVTQQLAADRMYASIDNFSVSVDRLKAARR